MGTSVSVFLQTFSLLIGCVRVSVALCHGCVYLFENMVTIIIFSVIETSYFVITGSWDLMSLFPFLYI